MKERISVALQGVLILLFGVLCLRKIDFELIGFFFVAAGFFILTTAMFGKDQTRERKSRE